MDKKLGILADTGRTKKVMQSYFEKKEQQNSEAKR
jgi:hypothetical protein